MQSVKFSESIIVNQPAHVVFDYTQDYNSRLSWDTFLRKAQIINGDTAAAKGVKRIAKQKMAWAWKQNTSPLIARKLPQYK